MRYEIGQMVRIKNDNSSGIILDKCHLSHRNGYSYRILLENGDVMLFDERLIEIYIPFNIGITFLKDNIQNIFTQHGYQPQYQFWSKWWKKLSLK